MTFVSRCDTVNQLSMQIESSSDMAPIFSIKSCHNVKLHRHHALNVFKLKHWVGLHFAFYCQALFKCQVQSPTRPTVLQCQDPFMYKVVGIRYRVKVFYSYFHLATLTYSPKSYGLLITFSLIMLDSPRFLLLLSTWSFFLLYGFRGSS